MALARINVIEKNQVMCGPTIRDGTHLRQAYPIQVPRLAGELLDRTAF